MEGMALTDRNDSQSAEGQHPTRTTEICHIHRIEMDKWQNGGGVSLRITHPHSLGRANVVSLDFRDVERLHALLEDYRNAPNLSPGYHCPRLRRGDLQQGGEAPSSDQAEGVNRKPRVREAPAQGATSPGDDTASVE